MTDVVIIGAGISGLTCAWTLRKLGIDSVVLDAASRAGGAIRTENVEGYLIDRGPNSILPTPQTYHLLDELDLGSEWVEPDPRAPRYIYTRGKLRKAPFGVLSVTGMLRMFGEPFMRSQPKSDESLADFVTRRLGAQAHERLFAPLITGIYAADTRQLSAAATFPKFVEMERKFGSLTMGMLRAPKKKTGRRPRLGSFAHGMKTLPERMSAGLNVRLGQKDLKPAEALATIVTTPAHCATGLLEHRYPTIARLLENVRYSPMVGAAVSLPMDSLTEHMRGFGFMVPRQEGLHILGTLYNSALFPNRAPEGRALFTSFLGGAFEPDAVDWHEERVWDTVCSELKRVFRISATPAPVALWRHNKALPQYRIGHERWVAALREELTLQPGLFITGNYLEGVSVPACMEQAEQTAKAVAEYVRKRR